jgi:hypothetical protein
MEQCSRLADWVKIDFGSGDLHFLENGGIWIFHGKLLSFSYILDII